MSAIAEAAASAGLEFCKGITTAGARPSPFARLTNVRMLVYFLQAVGERKQADIRNTPTLDILMQTSSPAPHGETDACRNHPGMIAIFPVITLLFLNFRFN